MWDRTINYLRRYRVKGNHRAPEASSEKFVEALQLAGMLIPAIFMVGLVIRGA